MEAKTKTENRTMRANNRGAVLITHDGKIKSVPYNGGGLHELYRLINCDYVEAVRLRGPLAGLSMWCDEEGKLCDHTANIPASLLFREYCGGDYMAGRVLVLADDPETGDAVALTEYQRQKVITALHFAAMSHYFGGGGEIEATGPKCRVYEF